MIVNFWKNWRVTDIKPGQGHNKNVGLIGMLWNFGEKKHSLLIFYAVFYRHRLCLAHLMKNVSTLPENLVTSIKKSNMVIYLVYGALEGGDLKCDIPDPVLGS